MANLTCGSSGGPDCGPNCGGRFQYDHIIDYLKDGKYPNNFHKDDKHALRKRAKYFTLIEGHLCYIGGKLLTYCSHKKHQAS